MNTIEITAYMQALQTHVLDSISNQSTTDYETVMEIRSKLEKNVLKTQLFHHHARTTITARTASAEYQLIDDTQDKQQGVSTFDKGKIDPSEIYVVTGVSFGHAEATAGTKVEVVDFKYLSTGSDKITPSIRHSELTIDIAGTEVLKNQVEGLLNNAAQDASRFVSVRPFLIKGSQLISARLKLPTNTATTGSSNDDYFEISFEGVRLTSKA